MVELALAVWSDDRAAQRVLTPLGAGAMPPTGSNNLPWSAAAAAVIGVQRLLMSPGRETVERSRLN